MNWYLTDPHPSRPSFLRRLFRKSSATVRWVVLIIVSGLALAASVAAAATALFTVIENGL